MILTAIPPTSSGGNT
jgi:hypothetical protein